MARRRLERSKAAREQWPLLSNLMVCHFNEDCHLLYGSLSGAISSATSEGSLDYRRALLKEWRDWNMSEGAVDDIRPFLDDGFGIAVRLDTPVEARNLMNRLYDELMAGVRAETRK